MFFTVRRCAAKDLVPAKARALGVHETACASGFGKLSVSGCLMAYSALAVIVIMANPGDTAEERAAIQLVLGSWNRIS